jgi:NADPH-dependent glutamate synthase beta subunit-like oxidoreductase
VTIEQIERAVAERAWSDAAGDVARGASLVVWAIADGRHAAEVIDAELSGAPPPVRS